MALITFTPTSRKVVSICFDFGKKQLGFGVLWSIAPKRVRQRHHPNLYPPQTVQLFNKIKSLSLLLIQKYPFMSVFKCCPPYLFHWGLVPVGSTVGTCEVGGWGGGVAASGSNTVLTSMVDTDRAAKILQPSRIPEEWTPPSVSVAPLLLRHSSLYFPPRPG